MRVYKYSIWWRKLLHKPIVALVRSSLTRKVKLICNEFVPNDKPAVYAATHVFVDDVPCAICEIEDSVFVLYGGGGSTTMPIMDRIACWLVGFIPVCRGDRESRRQSLHTITQILKNGGNILIFPEGSWNMTPAMPVKKLWWGLLDAAKDAEANIVPVAVQLVGNEYCVTIGERFEYEKFSEKSDQINALRDEMATLAWELIEMSPSLKREDVSDNYWLARARNNLKRAPWVSLAEEESHSFRPKGESSLGEVLADMHGLEYKSMVADHEQYKIVEQLIEGWTKPASFK